MSYTPTKEELKEAKEFIDKMTDNYGVALRVKMLIEQAEKVQPLEDEIKKRKKYEGFLKSVIRSGEDLDKTHTFEWFCELWGDILKD